MLEKKGLKGEFAPVLKNLQGEGALPDLGDRAVEANEASVQTILESIRWREVLRKRLEAEAALDRIVSGEYGTCEDCGEPISDARLQANPNALRCRDCQEKMELSTKRPKGFSAGFRPTL